MIRSMTGFGKAEKNCDTPHCRISVEVVSVNRKQLDLRLNLPRELAAMEPELRSKVAKKIGRGSVSVKINCDFHGGETTASVNIPLLRSLVEAAAKVRDEFEPDGAIDVAGLMRIPGVIDELDIDSCSDELSAAVGVALDEALDALQAMRRREGEALRLDLRQRLDFIRGQVAGVRQLTPQTVEHYRQRLDERVAELTRGMAIEPQRLAQEVALFADRVDVTEELTRLDTHLTAFGGLLDGDAAVGRRMDFLIQEINREVNTIGSKSQSAEVAQIVIALKAEIERIREQIQNIE